jgi:hypothetical protein
VTRLLKFVDFSPVMQLQIVGLLLLSNMSIASSAAASRTPVAVATWKFGMLAVDAAAPLLAAGNAEHYAMHSNADTTSSSFQGALLT